MIYDDKRERMKKKAALNENGKPLDLQTFLDKSICFCTMRDLNNGNRNMEKRYRLGMSQSDKFYQIEDSYTKLKDKSVNINEKQKSEDAGYKLYLKRMMTHVDKTSEMIKRDVRRLKDEIETLRRFIFPANSKNSSRGLLTAGEYRELDANNNNINNLVENAQDDTNLQIKISKVGHRKRNGF